MNCRTFVKQYLFLNHYDSRILKVEGKKLGYEAPRQRKARSYFRRAEVLSSDPTPEETMRSNPRSYECDAFEFHLSTFIISNESFLLLLGCKGRVLGSKIGS